MFSASGATGSRLIRFANGQPNTLLDMGNDAQPRFSADGARVTLSSGGAEQKPDIYVLTLASGTLDRLTTDGTSDRPEWSPDGARILFRSRLAVPVLTWKAVDGSGQAEQLSPAAERLPAQEGVLSPDGATLHYRVDRVNSSRNIFAANMTGDRTPRVFLNTEFDELTPRFSPDGRWVTYVSNESGHDEAYVRPYPGPGGRTLVSNECGSEPLWARDGWRVFYRAGSAVVAATISVAGAGVSVAARDTILRGNFIRKWRCFDDRTSSCAQMTNPTTIRPFDRTHPLDTVSRLWRADVSPISSACHSCWRRSSPAGSCARSTCDQRSNRR